MTVRLRPSMTWVAGPRRRKISSFLPMETTFPSEIAIASTNEGTPFVAILALCKMISDTQSPSSFSNDGKKDGSKLPPLFFTCELRQEFQRRIRGTSWLERRVPSCTRTRLRSHKLRSGSSRCPSRHRKFPCEPSRAATPAWLKATSRVSLPPGLLASSRCHERVDSRHRSNLRPRRLHNRRGSPVPWEAPRKSPSTGRPALSSCVLFFQ